MAAGMGWECGGDWQDPAALGPSPFLQSPGVFRGKNEHPSPGHHLIYFTGGETEAAYE